jgi:hypothetical protein
VELDFGSGAFAGEARWLQTAVRCPAGGGEYTTLAPRQALNPVPYALALPGLWTQQNTTSPNLIGGHSGNWVTSGAYAATIGGGGGMYPNSVTDAGGTVGGGVDNQAGDNAGTVDDASYATVGGGGGNIAGAESATVGGGAGNHATGGYTFIGGGSDNQAIGNCCATIGGGYSNVASGNQATVGGGGFNTASGEWSTVPGGQNNLAQGMLSFAAGSQAKALNRGCFVWADDNREVDVLCDVDNRWVARASGGVYFYTNPELTSGVYVDAGGNAWNQVSDRAAKENFTPADGLAILETLAALPVQEYNLKGQDDSIRHIGLVAQDFATFGYGESDTAINTQDADGVAMAAIQALYQQVQTLQAENADLEARVTALEQAVQVGRPAQTGTHLPAPWLLAGGLVVAGGAIASRNRLAGLRRRPGGDDPNLSPVQPAARENGGAE